MKVVCAWCNDHLRGDEDDKHVSHGMCQTCSDSFSVELNKDRDREEVLQPA